MKFLTFLTLALLMPTLAQAITVNDVYQMNSKMGQVASRIQLGSLVEQNVHVAQLVWDPSGKTAHRTGTAVAFSTDQETIPANSIVTGVFGIATTAVTSTSNNGTIAVNCLSAGDLLAAYDADPNWNTDVIFGGALTGAITAAGATLTTMLKVAAGCSPTFTVATNNFLTGKVYFFVKYVVME